MVCDEIKIFKHQRDKKIVEVQIHQNMKKMLYDIYTCNAIANDEIVDILIIKEQIILLLKNKIVSNIMNYDTNTSSYSYDNEKLVLNDGNKV